MDEITQDQREYIFFSKPDWIDIVCDNVANGGSIVNLAELIKIPHHKLLRSIRQSKEYSDKYSQALDDRKEWARETVLGQLNDVITKRTEEDALTGALLRAAVKDRLKAIELVMKNLSMLTEKHEVSGELTMGALVYKSYTDGKI